jgi:hypothetical protein
MLCTLNAMIRRAVITFLLLSIPFPALAATFQVGDTVEVETEGNAYAAGSVVQVTNRIAGDVYLIGEDVNVNARVDEDALLIGENVTVNSSIGDDLHAFGATIVINKSIEGDALLFGQKIIIGNDVKVFGSTVVGGENVTVLGQFDRDARLMGATIVIEGTFLDDLHVHAGRSLKISEKADIRGNLYLSVPESLTVTLPDGVVHGEVKKTFIEGKTYGDGKAFLRRFRLFSFLSRLLIGAIIIALARMFVLQYGSDLKQTFWKTLGLGALGLLVPPFAAIILFIPMITIPLALIVLVLWGTLLYFGSLLAGLLVANLLFPFQKTDTSLQLVGKFALGSLVLFLLRLIPFFGSPLTFVVFLLSLGSLLTYELRASKTLRKAKLL